MGAHSPPTDDTRPIAYVMVDGEFTGPNFSTHAVVAWGLVLFTLHESLQPAPRAWLPPVKYARHVELDSLVVRMNPDPQHMMDPATWHNFWAVPGCAPLLHWVKQNCVSQVEGATIINNFLCKYAKHYTLRFIAKPAGTDIARLRYCLSTYGPIHGSFVPHHNSICVLSLMHVVRRLMTPFGRHTFKNILRQARMAAGMGNMPSHFPVEDCRMQIVDYITCMNMLHIAVSERLYYNPR